MLAMPGSRAWAAPAPAAEAPEEGARPAPDSLVARFERAVDRWARVSPALAYDVSGWILESGELVRGARGLGCSAFAAAVLCELRYGEGAFDRQRRESADRPWVHQLWGDGIAAHFGLGEPARVFGVGEFLELAGGSARGEGLPQGLFFFDLRNERGRRGTYLPEGTSGGDIGHGHVGFLRIEGARIRQAHFSGLRTRDGALRYNGLARDERFLVFLERSLYGNTARSRAGSTLTLYRLDG